VKLYAQDSATKLKKKKKKKKTMVRAPALSSNPVLPKDKTNKKN
jgi:hypothetical protein